MLGDKRKGQCCLSFLTSNKHHTFSSRGRSQISIQRKRTGRNEWKTEWESGRKQAFPRITQALPGPAQFTTTKQPPCSHRGTSGQPLGSPWEQHRVLLGWKEGQLALFFSLGHTYTSISVWLVAPQACAHTHIHLMTALLSSSWLVIFQMSGAFREDQAATLCQSTWASLTNYRLALGIGAVLGLQNDVAEEEKKGMKGYWNPWLLVLIVVYGPVSSACQRSLQCVAPEISYPVSYFFYVQTCTHVRLLCPHDNRWGRTEPDLLSVILRQ